MSHESGVKGEVPFPKSFKERSALLKEDAKRFTRQLPATRRYIGYKVVGEGDGQGHGTYT